MLIATLPVIMVIIGLLMFFLAKGDAKTLGGYLVLAGLVGIAVLSHHTFNL